MTTTSNPFYWNTADLEETLREELQIPNSGSWDPIAEKIGETALTLKKYVFHDDRVTLKFTNGHKEYILHPDDDPVRAPDGDIWDVSELGWS
jgi:hypothetical protein